MMEKFKPICWHLPRPSKSKYKGSYPLHFETKLLKLIEFKEGEKLLHLFSGGSKLGYTVDIKPENNPDLVADCHKLPLEDNSFDVVLADPPYSDDYAKRLYDTPKLKPTKYLQEMVRVCKPGGIVILYHIHQIKHPVGCKYLGVLAIITRLYHKARVVTFYKKDIEL